MAQLSRRETSTAAVAHAFELSTEVAEKVVHLVASELRRRSIRFRKFRRLHEHALCHAALCHIGACVRARALLQSRTNPPTDSPAFSFLLHHHAVSRGDPLIVLLATIASRGMHALNWQHAPAALTACSGATRSCAQLLTLLAAFLNFAKISHAASLFSPLATSQVRLSRIAPPLSAPPPTLQHFLHLPASCGTLTITSSSLLSRHSIPNRLMHSRPAQTPQALATPLVGAACHFAHCPQHCSACTLYFRRMCTNSSSPVCQQHHHRQTTQGFGAG